MPERSGTLMSALVIGGAILLGVLAITATANAEGLPDLVISRKGPASATALTTFAETVKITNRGTAAATAVAVDYEPDLGVSSPTAGVGCTPILKGHSGRGGGYTQVGWACSPTLKAPLAPKKSVKITLDITAPRAGTLSETLTAATTQAQLNLVSHTVLDGVTVVQPPLPGAPAGLHATRVGDSLQVSWTPAAATEADITSTSIIAEPVGETAAPPLGGSQGGAGTTGTVGPAVANTTYRITVISYDAAGASPESEAIEYMTPPSTVPPSPPIEIRTWWLLPTEPVGSYLVGWAEGSSPGDSAVDEYEIQAVPAEGEVASTLTNYEPASSRETEFTGNSETPWTIRLRARNAAGWGAWSPPVERGGL
jgi:hypothetical protein